MTRETGSRSLQQSESAASQTETQIRRIAACTGCRNVKAKCETADGQQDCVRCRRRDEVCERPAIQRGGRPKGSKNQQTALERALQVIEREVHRNKRPRLAYELEEEGPSSSAWPKAALPPSSSVGPRPSIKSSSDPSRGAELPAQSSFDYNSAVGRPFGPMLAQSNPYPFAPLPSATNPTNVTISPQSLASQPSQPAVEVDQGEDHSLSNPVRLLAEAAEESNPEAWGQTAVQPVRMDQPILPPQYTLPETIASLLVEGNIDHRVASLQLDDDYLAEGLQALLADNAHLSLADDDKRFFKPARNQVKRDLGPEYDPLELALVTLKEVNVFFASFFSKLHPVMPVLDPALHTPEFVRGRSSFLLTAICAHGASLTVGAEEATKRLRIHAQRLSELISRRGFASVEIVQAFLVWISWLPSSHPFQEEKLWHETKYAINMAVELEIAKPPSSDPLASVQENASLPACLFGVADGDQGAVERLLRNRQRLWLHLFLWDSSLSLAFGKATRFSQDYLTRDENWCFHPLATAYDRVTTACVVLRRRMVGLSDTLRSEILMRAGATSEWVLGKVDEVLDPWHSFWAQQCDHSPYVELLYRHSRLWALSYALQTMSLRDGLTQALTEDCFASALSTCEFVCEQLRQSRGLWGFPNTMGPMLSFEVLLAVRLFPVAGQNGPASRARVLGLLAQLSSLLERVGTTPPHRLGTAAVYGRHLQVYLRRRVIALCVEHERKEACRYNGSQLALPMSDGRTLPSQQAEMTMEQLFASNQVSPIDQAQSSMALNWNDVNTLNFLDSAAGWTEDFFRIFGNEQ